MELYQLRTFVEVARTNNLTEASIVLNTSQPAASAHIKALEDTVGFELFERTSRGMTLTEKGAKLLTEAKQILNSVDQFHLKANELTKKPAEKLNIGLNTDGDVLRIRELIQEASKLLPNTELHFPKTRSEDFIDDLTISKINAGFYYGAQNKASIEEIKLQTYKMVIVYPSSWTLKESTNLLDQFSKKPWIWTTSGCPFYQESINFFSALGFEPQTIMHVDDEILIGSLVGTGVGCSLLAEPIANKLLKDNKLKIWKNIDLTISLYYGFPKALKIDPNLSTLSEIIFNIWN